VSFSIADSGIGIAPEKIATIFDEFAQADYDISMRFGGSGLGLAICKKIVEMHGSRIHVSSEFGVGSTFTFDITLPMGVTPIAKPAEYHQPNPAQLDGLRVLVAEDNEDNIFLLGRLLARWGVQLTTARNGREAVDQVREGEFDLVLMDLRMPVMDGYAATNAIRALPGKSKNELPILAFSASTKVGEEDLVTITPFNDVIGKPFRVEELFSKLAFHGGRVQET
jgi:CheY-like chemotaxis protein